MNTVICTMSLSLPPAFSSVALMSLKICRTCPSRSPASDLPESSTIASCPASHTILPPSVITACERPQTRGYSQAVITEGGKIVWLAGQLAIVDDSGKSLAGDLDGQVRQI